MRRISGLLSKMARSSAAASGRSAIGICPAGELLKRVPIILLLAGATTCQFVLPPSSAEVLPTPAATSEPSENLQTLMRLSPPPPMITTDDTTSSPNNDGISVLFIMPFQALDMTMIGNSSFAIDFKTDYANGLVNAVSCPEAWVEIQSFLAGSVLVATVVHFPVMGECPAGSMRPSELAQAVASSPESLFSFEFLAKYGPLVQALAVDVKQAQEEAQPEPFSDAAIAVIASMIGVGSLFAAASITALMLWLKKSGTFIFKLRRSGLHLDYRHGGGLSHIEKGEFSSAVDEPLTSPTGGEFGRGNLLEEGLRIMTSEELVESVNHWSSDRRLGAGGQANVYKAKVAWSRRPLAVKRLANIQAGGEVRQEAQTTFVQEAEKLFGLGSHPNIIHIYAICPEECALVMELGSKSLHDGLAKEPLLPWRKRLNFLHDIATALAHVHSSEMLHLDIKPANIIINKDGNDALLADFGMADNLQPGNSHIIRAGPVGTVVYKDTFCHDGTLRPARDIYSMGVTILEAVCGEMAHILLQGLRDERVEGWWAAETRGVVKQRLLAKIDTRQGVTGDLGPDLQTWNACASSLLDLALNCVAENRKQRPSAEALVRGLMVIQDEAGGQEDEIVIHRSSASGSAPPPLSSGRGKAVMEQLLLHWRLVDKCITHLREEGMKVDEKKLQYQLKFFGSAIDYAEKEIGILSKEEAMKHRRRNDLGNAAKHTHGQWNAGAVVASGGPMVSALPDVPLEGIDAVLKQLKEHMALVDKCKNSGLDGGEGACLTNQSSLPLKQKTKQVSQKSMFGKFARTIDYAFRHGIIDASEKERLKQVNEQGNKWKHEEAPGLAELDAAGGTDDPDRGDRSTNPTPEMLRLLPNEQLSPIPSGESVGITLPGSFQEEPLSLHQPS